MLGVAVLAASAGAIAMGMAAPGMLASPPSYRDLPRVEVVRADLRPSVVAAGTIDTGQKTIVECDLEPHFSPTSRATGISTIIELIPDGTMVTKGQMLARLDASDYEELVRQEEIQLLQARADWEKAGLDLKTAEIALAEYRDGLLPQNREFQQGQILLYESDIRRANDRLAWAERMVASGYLSAGQLLIERASLERSEVSLRNARGELATLEQHTSAAQISRLKLDIAGKREQLDFHTRHHMHREGRLKKARKQVEACTIRAPHAGLVIYANTYNPETQIAAGSMAYNRMNLFYLPDLSRAEVKVEIHEAQIRKVRVGQKARVRVEGLSSRLLEAHVKAVDRVALEPKRWWMSREIRSFSAVIAIHSPPPGVLPGMNAEVAIECDERPSALVVPSTAVVFEKGRDLVYVVGRDGLERRAVEVETGDTRSLEVRAGLTEGEQVLRDPSHLDPDLAPPADSPIPDTPGPSAPARVYAAP